MKVIEKPIDAIKPYKNNNKIHDNEQILRIANSIKEYWFTQPIAIDKNDIIIIGHWRYEAAKRLNLEKVPCVVMDGLTKAQVKKLRILDNKLNESEWDIWNLKLEFDWLDDFNFWDLNIWKFDLFPELETHDYNWWWFEEVSFKARNKEFTEDDLGEFEHTCPKCWFWFND